MTWRWITLEGGRQIYRNVEARERKRSDLPAPMLIRDQMDALRNMADGQTYDSKTAFRKATKASGCVETGNDVTSASPREDASLRDDVGKALQQVKSGYKPASVETAVEGWN